MVPVPAVPDVSEKVSARAVDTEPRQTNANIDNAIAILRKLINENISNCFFLVRNPLAEISVESSNT